MILPAILVAAGILAFYTWKATANYAQLGERTIAESTLLLVRQKAGELEDEIIATDNRVFDLFEELDPSSVQAQWPRLAPEISPGVRAMVVFDGTGHETAFHLRAPRKQRKAFRQLVRRVVPKFRFDDAELGVLAHYHAVIKGKNVLFAHQRVSSKGRTFQVLLQHDVGYLLREVFPLALAGQDGRRLYNVIDERTGRRVFGESLENAGAFVVGSKFPTTLYGWRLQAAPQEAPLLEQRGRSKRRTEVSLIVVSLGVILLGVFSVLYGTNRERRFNRLRADFVANVSHELKTPLSVIRMFAEMLSTNRVPDADKRRQYLEIIFSESERLSTLIENVLDFAAVDRGKQTYQLRPGDLCAVTRRAVETFRYRSEKEGTSITLDKPAAPVMVVMDEQAVLLAVVNLLDNAVKYGQGSAISVVVREQDETGVVVVRDHGVGIPEEDLRRIFLRFYRSRGKENVRGSGIGLALVQNIAEAHDGRCWAENPSDGGARVAFSIPLAKVPSAPEEDADETIPSPIHFADRG